MATSIIKTCCSMCSEDTSTFICKGCLKEFCFDHLTEHREILKTQFNQIENDYNQFRQTLIYQKNNPNTRLLIQQINKWEQQSIHKIKQTADQSRQRLIYYTNKVIINIQDKLDNTIPSSPGKNQFNEIHLEEFKQKLNKLKQELDKPANVSIQQESTAFIHQISVIVPFHEDTKWKQEGITIAGGKGQGNQLNQLYSPHGIFIDDDQTIYIADWENDRIVEWKCNATNGQIVAGGNGCENKTNHLYRPRDLIIDKRNNSLIISNQGNRRVMRWSREKNTNNEEVIIKDIDCDGLTMDKNGSLYASDWKKNEVRRWKRGDQNGTIVAGGNGKGNYLNQLNTPTHIFVDEDYSLYVSDQNNHRVMKWMKDAKEGIVVAGGNDEGNSLTQLSYPQGVIIGPLGQIYVADYGNDRVMRWCKGAKEGTIVVGGNGRGQQSNQLNGPIDLSFDRQGNLYVADYGNHRIQKFDLL